MHILIAIAGALGVGLFWWYRLRAAGDAAKEIADFAGKARGAIVRKNFRNKAAKSPFTAIDDPVIGAATIAIAMATEIGGFGPEAEASLRSELARVAKGTEQVDEAVIYGKWAAGQTAEATTPIRLIAPLLNELLSEGEREDLVGIVGKVTEVAAGNSGIRTQLMKTLRGRLGLPVA